MAASGTVRNPNPADANACRLAGASAAAAASLIHTVSSGNAMALPANAACSWG
jgi:hypothetical protein